MTKSTEDLGTFIEEVVKGILHFCAVFMTWSISKNKEFPKIITMKFKNIFTVVFSDDDTRK